MLGLGGGTPDRAGDLSVLSNPTAIYEWNHQVAAARLLAQRNGKRFGLFARYHYFGGGHLQLSAADWQWNWDRHIPLFNPEVMSTLPAGYYLTQADIEDPYKPLFAGSNGHFGASWSARMASLRCALNPTGAAGNPAPSHGATNRPVSQALSWTAGAHATSQGVYFGTSPGGLDVTAGTPWKAESYAPVPDANGIWFNTIPNANDSHQYAAYVRYDVITSVTCTYAANGGITWCP